jgi:hypothetical protein
MYVIQVGRGPKGSYRTRYTFSAEDWTKASFYYACINVGYGYKKRLVRDGKVIARCYS